MKASEIISRFPGISAPSERTPVTQPSGAGQAAVTLGNTDGAIGNLSIGATYSQAEVQALRDKCEQLADDGRAAAGLVAAGVVKCGT